MNTKNTRMQILVGILIFLTGFLTGFLTLFIIPQYRAIIEEKNELSSEEQIAENKEKIDISKFWKVLTIVKSEFYDGLNLDETQIEDGVIKGFVESLGDPHTKYFDKQEEEDFEKYISGDFEGIGAYIEENPEGIKLSKVMKDSPADKAGLITGDIITEVDGNKLAGLTVEKARNYISGKAGTKSIFTVKRQGEENLLEKTVTRDVIVIPSVFSEVVGDNLGYIGINKFVEHTAEEFEQELTDLEKEKVDGIIIDLRLNGGGYLFSAVQIASNFIKGGQTIVTTKYKNFWENQEYTSINNGILYDKPVVILIDRNSASASEILTLAMKDYKKAILVGEKSYGKGSVQAPIDLGDGTMLKLTIAKWFSPNDTNIDGIGIEPDIEVLFKEEDYKNLYDRQFEEAKKILQKYIETSSIEETISYFNNLNIEEENDSQNSDR